MPLHLQYAKCSLMALVSCQEAKHWDITAGETESASPRCVTHITNGQPILLQYGSNNFHEGPLLELSLKAQIQSFFKYMLIV
uniref:Uncharacterized protein n=1 Tax=Anguilla anguilla TaxID=7936 RepID=A0A0E9TH50_ANGAN